MTQKLLALVAVAMLWSPSAYAAKPNPLTQMLGNKTDKGTFFAGDKAIPVTGQPVCEPIGSGDSIMCHGNSGPNFAWLDVFHWDPKTGWITKTSLTTTPGERLVVMSGVWDAKTRTLRLKGVQRKNDGTETPVRSTREFKPDGSMVLRYFITESGKERLSLEVVSKPQ